LTRRRVPLDMQLCRTARLFLCPSPLRLATIIFSLRFETSRFVASYDSQGHCGSILLGLHTERNNGWMISCVSTHELPNNKHSTLEWRHILRGGLFTEHCVVTGWERICDVSRTLLCAIHEFTCYRLPMIRYNQQLSRCAVASRPMGLKRPCTEPIPHSIMIMIDLWKIISYICEINCSLERRWMFSWTLVSFSLRGWHIWTINRKSIIAIIQRSQSKIPRLHVDAA
jgi:hypothetical protein